MGYVDEDKVTRSSFVIIANLLDDKIESNQPEMEQDQVIGEGLSNTRRMRSNYVALILYIALSKKV